MLINSTNTIAGSHVERTTSRLTKSVRRKPYTSFAGTQRLTKTI